ncbi:hypothetical protein PHLCEN_2v3424, partial [Hermanssonia centrifuga]
RIDDMITINLNGGGQISARSQVTDYRFRGEELDDYSVYEFFMNTYEMPKSKGKEVAAAEEDQRHPSSQAEAPRRRGRTANVRSPYLSEHPNATQKERVVRTPRHRNLVNFVGRFFPSREDPTIHEFYCASMLMLLKPWRNVATDLKCSNQSWMEGLQFFLQEQGAADGLIQRRVSGIQTFHDSRAAALRDHENADQLPLDDVEVGGVMRGIDDVEFDDNSQAGQSGNTITEESLQALICSQIPAREQHHARKAIEVAKGARVFPQRASEWTVITTDVGNATGGEIVQLAEWKAQMERDVVQQNAVAPSNVTVEASDALVQPLVAIPNRPNHAQPPSVQPSAPIRADGILQAADPSMLKADQFRAFDIVRWHLAQTLNGLKPPPLRMILYGEGGTGKSKVIQTITEEFVQRAVKSTLVKAAYTGVAASIIDGKTTHTIAGLSVRQRGDTLSDVSKSKLQQFWKDKRYLIIDEVSMIGKSFLVDIERNVSIGMQGGEGFLAGQSFGGLNVILCGDYHQFPPVAKGKEEYLFEPADITHHQEQSIIGRRLYEEFSVVVILHQQMRVTDEVWRDLLVHLRNGQVQSRHIACLRSLIINRPGCEANFTELPWKNASLVTPRHAVRTLWNEHAARKWCKESGNQLFVCSAEDRIREGKGRPSPYLSLAERYAVVARHKTATRRRKQDLPRTVELAKGMKVLVTSNLETDLDLTNGARGEIIDIILDPDESAVGTDGVVHLKYLPVYVLVRMERTRASQLPGLDPGVIPVEPMTTTMQIKLGTHAGKEIKRTVRRRQYPITPAYAFTDYRAQGQTLPYVVVDIATPPSGTLSLFNLYVALSRSSGRQTIRLLRDFDEKLFMQAHDAELILEDERLGQLDSVTMDWWRQVGGVARMEEAEIETE